MSEKTSALSKLGKILFTKNPAQGLKDSVSFINVPYSLSKGAQKALTAGVIATTGAVALGNMRNVNKMGEITAGGLSDMTMSVKPSAQVTSIQNGAKLYDNLRNNGATGDIVFALHNMR